MITVSVVRVWGVDMFENRRSEIEIVAEILRLSLHGARKTEILYRGNLSYTQLMNYLSFLLEKDILKETVATTPTGNSCKVYRTTDKGNDLLTDISKTLTYFE